MFKEFQSRTKAEWLAKVEKDLKGKPLESLDFKFQDDAVDGEKPGQGVFNFSPFAHQEDLKEAWYPWHDERLSNEWEMGMLLYVEEDANGQPDFEATNKAALTALEGGANALCFCFGTLPTKDELRILLKDIQHEWISTSFWMVQPSGILIDDFIAILEEKGQDTRQVKCSFKINLEFEKADFVRWIETLPFAKLIVAEQINFKGQKEKMYRELANLLSSAHQAFVYLEEQGLALEKYYKTIQFSVNIHDSHFLNIAKVRAIKLLWQQLLEAWGMKVSAFDLPFIEAHINEIYQTADENYNKIKATTQAMSAIIGGVKRLYVYPSDANIRKNGTAFSRRIALNVQHLLQQESYFNRVIDPAAGSYYIEEMTNRIAAESWELFKLNN